MKRHIYNVLTAIMMAIVMVGCTADEYLNDITVKNPAQQTAPEETLSDDVSEALAAVDGISDVTIQDSLLPDGTKERYYFFYVEQPVTHYDKSLGTYKQHACLRTKDLTAPVLVYTHGYNMENKAVDVNIDDVAIYLGASELHVEHRYFGSSLPEPYETLAFTYLNADEAAHDLDSVLVKLQRTVLKDSKQWVSIGTSKDGMTTALLAYYADMYGWNNEGSKDYFKMDLYMPFCAPFLVCTPESCDDPQMGYYLYYDCGNGYEEGSEEERAYRRLRQIPEAIVTNKDLREACLKKFHVNAPDSYVEAINTYGRNQEMVSAALLTTYFNYLFEKFSYVPFSEWAHLVPNVELPTMDAVTEIEALIKGQAITILSNFVFMDADRLEQALSNEKKYKGGIVNAKETSSVVHSPKIYNDSEILTFLYANPINPYYIQAARELGNIRLDFSMLDGIKFSEESTKNMGYLALTFSKQSEVSTMLAKYADQWDGGQLMSSFRSWVDRQTVAKMIFVYQENDPWTGGAINARDDNYVKRLIFKNGAHNDFILNTRYYPETDCTQLKSAIDMFLK